MLELELKTNLYLGALEKLGIDQVFAALAHFGYLHVVLCDQGTKENARVDHPDK